MLKFFVGQKVNQRNTNLLKIENYISNLYQARTQVERGGGGEDASPLPPEMGGGVPPKLKNCAPKLLNHVP